MPSLETVSDANAAIQNCQLTSRSGLGLARQQSSRVKRAIDARCTGGVARAEDVPRVGAVEVASPSREGPGNEGLVADPPFDGRGSICVDGGAAPVKAQLNPAV